MIRAVVIDDERNGRELVTTLLKQYCPAVQVVAEGSSVETGHAAISEHLPDLVFLDVQMPDGTGFDLLRKLGRTDFHLVFITAHEQYAIEAFRFCALDYLLKPLQPDELIATVQRIENISSASEDIRFKTLMEYMTSAEKKKRKIVLKTLERVYSIEISSILRLEAEGSYTNVHLADGNKIMVSRQLKEFDELLSPNGYLRVHQSHLVNTEHLFYFDKSESYLVLKDNSSVPVSSRKKELVLEVLNSL